MPATRRWIRVRKARLPEERPAIDAVHSAAYEATHRTLLAGAEPWFDPRGTCFVAVDDSDAVCGFVYVVLSAADLDPDEEPPCEEPPIPRVDDLFVHPQCQSAGCGSALLSAAEALAAPATLHLCVLEADARARRFYAERGWREGARFRCAVDGGAYLHASKACAAKPALGHQSESHAENLKTDVPPR